MTALWLLVLLALPSQDQHHAGVNRRGEAVMGFDQTATAHHFRLSSTGGDIEVTANSATDMATIDRIRMHLQHIAGMFVAGDFTAPMLIHAKEPPGVAAMKKAGAAITYTYEPIERGGVVRIATTSARELDAVHDFLRFQIKDHRTRDPTPDGRDIPTMAQGFRRPIALTKQ